MKYPIQILAFLAFAVSSFSQVETPDAWTIFYSEQNESGAWIGIQSEIFDNEVDFLALLNEIRTSETKRFHQDASGNNVGIYLIRRDQYELVEVPSAQLPDVWNLDGTNEAGYLIKVRENGVEQPAQFLSFEDANALVKAVSLDDTRELVWEHPFYAEKAIAELTPGATVPGETYLVIKPIGP